MKTLFRPRTTGLDRKLQTLREEREQCMARIRNLRGDMDALVQRALDADDLDQKILSLDYAAMKGSLNVESERFQDLSRLITRIQDVQAMEARGRRMDFLASVRDGIDEAALRREEDEIQIRRERMEEEDARNALDGAPSALSETAFVPDADFACRLTQARRQRQAQERARAAAEPEAQGYA